MTKVTQDRNEQVFVHEGYKLFITTGQWEGDAASTLGARRRSGLLIQPFNTLDAQSVAALREQARPFGAKSYITVSETAQPGMLSFTDDLTQGVAAVPVSALDADVQARLSTAAVVSTFRGPVHPIFPAPSAPRRSGLKQYFATAILGIAGFCGLGGVAYNELHTGAGSGPSLTQEFEAHSGMVKSQTVRTLFISGEYSDEKAVGFVPGDEKVPTRVVSGSFSKDEAYRYDIVLEHTNTRDGNRLISFTSGDDLLAGTDKFDVTTIRVPEGARVVPLESLSAAERQSLRAQYEDMESAPHAWSDGAQRQSLPTGLANTADYLKPGRDGYSFQTWNDVSNGVGGAQYFRDVTGVYGDEGMRPGKKVLTELTIREEGKYCAVAGQPDEYDHRPNTNAPGCQRIETMTPDAVAALKSRAAAVDIALVDETLHTYVRDAQGKVVSEDATRTLTTPAHLVTRLLAEGTDERDIQGPLDTYVFMDLNPAGDRVARIITATFAKGTFAPGVVPPVKATGGHEYGNGGFNGDKGRPEYDVAGQKVWADTDPTGYEIRYDAGRFAAHGKPSHLPTRQRNEFGA